MISGSGRLSRIALMTLIGVTAMACGGRMYSVVSHPSPGDIEVEGVQAEWGEVLEPLGEDGVWFGAMNDDEAVYLTLVTNRLEFAQQMVLMGVTLWLDAGGEKRWELGLRFPTAMGRGARVMDDDSSAGLPGAGPEDFPGRDPGDRQGMGRAGAPADAEQTRQLLERALASVGDNAELIISGEEPVRYALSELPGVELALAFSNSALVYEVRVPLADDPNAPFSIAASPGEQIAVGFTTPDQRGRGRGRGGMGGGRGGMGGGRGGTGRMGGGRSSMPERLDVWVRIELVAPQTTPQREP